MITLSVSDIVATLRAGDVAVIPTETVYGLAADIHSVSAIQKIFSIKKRPNDHPLIVHIADKNQLMDVAADIPDYVHPLIDAFWPGPLTLVLRKTGLISPLVTAGQDTVAVRCPAHPLAHEVISRLGSPIVAPSANYYNEISPTSAKDVQQQFRNDHLLILEGGECHVGIESTIVDATQKDKIQVLRPGMISAAQIESIAHLPCHHAAASSIKTPGMRKKHYAPRKKTLCIETQNLNASGLSDWKNNDCYFLLLDAPNPFPSCISKRMPDDPNEYARQLYRELIKADHSDCTVIIIELPPNTITWTALRDRLLKAAGS